MTGPGPAGSHPVTRRTRDPQARRAALAAATMEVIGEVGVGRTTHRAVAARAGLPLGATTYYFPTLDDLIAAGLRHALDRVHAELADWGGRLRAATDLAATLAELTAECLTDRHALRLEFELYVAAVRDPTLRPLAAAWLHGLPELLEPYVGPAAARDLCALIDGVLLQALVAGGPLDAAALTTTIRRLTT